MSIIYNNTIETYFWVFETGKETFMLMVVTKYAASLSGASGKVRSYSGLAFRIERTTYFRVRLKFLNIVSFYQNGFLWSSYLFKNVGVNLGNGVVAKIIQYTALILEICSWTLALLLQIKLITWRQISI